MLTRIISQLAITFYVADVALFKIMLIHNMLESFINSGQDFLRRKYKNLSREIILRTKLNVYLALMIFIIGSILLLKNYNYFILVFTLFSSLFFIPVLMGLREMLIKLAIYIPISICFLVWDKYLFLIWCLGGFGLISINNIRYIGFSFNLKVFREIVGFYRLTLITMTYNSLPSFFITVTVGEDIGKKIWVLEKLKNVVIVISPPILRSLIYFDRFTLNFNYIFYIYTAVYLALALIASILIKNYFLVDQLVFLYMLIPFPVIYGIVYGFYKNGVSSDFNVIFKVYNKVALIMLLPMCISYWVGWPECIALCVLVMESFIAYEFYKFNKKIN